MINYYQNVSQSELTFNAHEYPHKLLRHFLLIHAIYNYSKVLQTIVLLNIVFRFFTIIGKMSKWERNIETFDCIESSLKTKQLCSLRVY